MPGKVPVMIAHHREDPPFTQGLTAFIYLAVITGRVAQADDLLHTQVIQPGKDCPQGAVIAMYVRNDSDHRQCDPL
ncbi:hypothetical protein D9M71_806110 [compost metagenome]